MLALPLQRGESVDISASFYSFIQSQYGDESVSSLGLDVAGFQQARDAAVCATEPSDHSAQHILRYNYHMNSVAPRLTGYESELRLSLGWFDAFRTSRKIQVTSFYVDWASVLWNLAAMESQRGAKIDRGSEEGIRNANKHFQQAAGIFEFIRKQLLPHFQGPYMAGLSDEGLNMVTQLMLAQAQLCFYEKAVRDRKAGTMKPAVVSKLATQAALYYSAARDSCQGSTLSVAIDASWANHCDFQAKSFGSASEYWQAQASKEIALQRGTGYGEEIVRLTVAERVMRGGLEAATRNKLVLSLTQSGEALLNTILAAKQKAIQENHSIYMESIPSESTLTPIVGVSMVRPAGMPEFYNSEKPFFKDVLPKTVRLLRGSFRDQVDSIIRQATIDAGQASNQARSTLSSVGLPGSVEAFKTGGKLPDALWAKIARVQELGGLPQLRAKHQELESAAARALQSMASIDETMSREEKTDYVFRQRFPKWTGASSAVLNNDVRTNNSRMRDAFASARESDGVVQQEILDASFVTCCDTLALSREDIVRSFPVAAPALLDFSGMADGGHSVDVTVLEAKLMELAGLIEGRDRSLEALNNIALGDVTEEMLSSLASGGDPSSVSATHISRCDAHVMSIAQSILRQDSLLSSVLAANEAFVKAQQWDPVTVERDKIVKNLEQCTTRYFNIHSQLVAGVTFYSNLQARLSTLQQNCDDLCYSQQLLRQEYELTMTHEAERAAQRLQEQQMMQQQQQQQQQFLQQQQQFQQQQQQQQFQQMQMQFQNLTPSQPAVYTATAPAPVPGPYPTLPAVAAASSSSSTSSPYVSTAGFQQSPQPPPLSTTPGQLPSDQLRMQDVYYGQPVAGPPGRPVPQTAASSYQPPNPNPNPGNYSVPMSAYPAASQYQQAPPVHYQQQQAPAAPYPSQQQQQQYQPAPGPAAAPSNADLHNRALRLSEMGFSYEQCMQALQSSSGDEETALNMLLSGADVPAATSAPQAPPAAAAPEHPVKPPKPSGLFSKVWGRSK